MMLPRSSVLHLVKLLCALLSPATVLHVVCFIVVLMPNVTSGQGTAAGSDTATFTVKKKQTKNVDHSSLIVRL